MLLRDTPQFNPTSTESESASGSLLALDESVSDLSIKSSISNDSGHFEPRSRTLSRRATTHIQGQLQTLNAAVESSNRSGRALNGEAMQDLIGKHLGSTIHGDDTLRYLAQTVDILAQDVGELKLQGNVLEQLARKMIDMQQQALDRLTLIQSKTEAILTQQLELVEYPIPRLFIVLPEVPTKYDPGNWFRTKFCLHFICECGKHTEASNSKIPNHLHLAKHEGYVIREPTEFFKNYGPFLLLMLELIKFGTSVAGHVVPTLASLKVVELADYVRQSVELVAAKIDYSLQCINKQLAKMQVSSSEDMTDTESQEAMTQQDLTNYLNNVEGLEGVELRQLGSFLKISEEEGLLGNLYRMTTPEGHVKWVCRDHYRAGYQEKYVQKLRDIVTLSGGEFDEQLGKIKITLKSSIAATEFYDTVVRARGILDLNLEMHWNQGYADLVGLKDMMRKSNIRSIIIHLHRMTGPTFDIKVSTRRRYDPIVEIIRLPALQSFGIDGVPRGFLKRSSAWPMDTNCSNLRHLTIGRLDPEEDIAILSLLAAQVPNLNYLALESDVERLPAIFTSIAGYQTYLIEFRNLSLRFLPPRTNSRPTKVVLQDLPQLLKVHGAQVESLDLCRLVPNDLVTDALVEATQNGSRLKVLSLDGSDGCLGDKSSKDIASNVARSELHTLRIKLDDADRHVRVLNAIQWEHIRRLEIRETQHSREMAMRALVDGMEIIPERVQLESLLYSDYVVSTTRLELMRRVLSLLSLKHLELRVTLTLEQTLDICGSIDFSRMQSIFLECRRWGSCKTQVVLEALEHATQLSAVNLGYGDITEAQKE
ncbi:hypothetical protein BGZ70_008808 [Mortierella alpina]|uniref:Uncharacterized protein n=1 Tax=Mortierella alpina TaxID=64518 RepID=A0A9P6J320_MORAP|nr:hypothetical protein BGZ70_008808 [Mortierella alpina]